MIHMAGFNQEPAFNIDYLLGPAWFISSQLLALIPFSFLCRRYGKTFTGVIAPICMAVIYEAKQQSTTSIGAAAPNGCG